jgi:hypothetical protein
MQLPHNFEIAGEPSNVSAPKLRSPKRTHIDQLMHIFDVHLFPANVADEVHQT